MDSTVADRANTEMVDRMVAEGALWSPSLMSAFRATPRHRFLDRVFIFHRRRNRWKEVLTRDPEPSDLALVYADRAVITGLSGDVRQASAVPISSSSQPSLMAQMLEDLALEPGMRVLEVGTGTGYNAALMAHVVGPGRVTSIDVDRDVLSRAWDSLRGFAERGIELRHADGRQGYPVGAPYDRIIVTAAAVDLEPAWLEQVTTGGRILVPLVLAPGLEYIASGTVSQGVFQGRLTRAAYFMPLRAEGESGSENTERFPEADTMESTCPPWAGWFDRRRLRTSWLGLSQSLACFAFVRGLEVHVRSLEDGAIVAVQDAEGRGCWLGQEEWQFRSSADRDFAETLWTTFLEAGGPRPTEYELQATVTGDLPTGGHARQGPRCRQRWELIAPRERPGWL